MKKILLLFFLFITASCYAQKAKKQVEFSWATPAVYFNDFKSDTSNSNFKEINPIKIYSKSSTIFDETHILLLEKNTFLASFVGCTQRTITSGYYRINNDTLILKSLKKVFKTISKNKKIEELSYEFIEIGERNYLIIKEGLEYLN
jgi:hypothetical protein